MSAKNYRLVSDNEMTLNCPIGYQFDWESRKCLGMIS